MESAKIVSTGWVPPGSSTSSRRRRTSKPCSATRSGRRIWTRRSRLLGARRNRAILKKGGDAALLFFHAVDKSDHLAGLERLHSPIASNTRTGKTPKMGNGNGAGNAAWFIVASLPG